MQTDEQGPLLPVAAGEYAGMSLPPAIENQFSRLRPLLIAGFGFCALLSVAFYNGYPTLFSDSGSYLWTGAFFKALPPFRAPGYSVFTRLTSLAGTAWYTVAAQSVIAVYVLFEACDYLASGVRKNRDRLLLASLCALTLLTSLPWLVAQIMPDIFAGLLFLSATLLAFAARLHPIRRIVLAAVLMISVAAHMSLLPVATLFVAVLALGRIFSRCPQTLDSKKSALLWLAVPVVASAFGTAALNRSMGLGFRVSPSGKTFLLARLFGDHLATDFLQANCPRRAFISCRYLADLPQSQDAFLFQHPLVRELDGHEDEITEISRGAILAHPLRFVRSSVWETLRQLVHLRTGDEIRSYGAKEWNLNGIQEVLPNDLEAFERSRQSRDRLLPLADVAAALHTRVFWLSLAACLPLAWTGRFVRVNEIFFAALVFLVINAAVCATFAGVYDRYQSRVAWILPLCLTAYVYSAVQEWKRSEASEFPARLWKWQEAPAETLETGGYSLRGNECEALDIEPDPS